MYIGYIRAGELVTPECRRRTDDRQLERLTDLLKGIYTHYGIDDIVCFNDDGYKHSREWVVWRLNELLAVEIVELQTTTHNDNLHDACIKFHGSIDSFSNLLTMENAPYE